MTTRRHQRAQARAARASALVAADRSRRRRRHLITALVVAVAVLVGAIAVSSRSGAPTQIVPVGPGPTGAANGVARVLAGVPQRGEMLGDPHAPLTLTYYGDLECSICREFSVGSLPTVIAVDVRTGRLKIDYRSLQTATGAGPTFATQQSAAYAAGRQNKAWNYIELFYDEQGAEDSGYATTAYLDGLARQISGLNLPRWQSDRVSAALAAQVRSDHAAFVKLGLQQATPTLIVSGPRGSRGVQAPASPSQIAALMSAVA